LHSGRIGGVFKLRCIPSFLQKWLMPRLPLLERAFPDLQLRIIAEDSSGSLRDDDFDLAIDLNDGSYPGLSSTALLEERLFPVCSPGLLAVGPPLDSPGQLIHYPLLHDITAWRGSYEYAEWEFYLSAIGASGIDVRRGHTFNRNHLTIEAAILGMGVAIARQSLITDELERGALVIPFGQAIAARKKYMIAYREDALRNPARRAVHDWLVRQAVG
jgi:LysR family glycine cleavage system transcriptional activator